MHLRRLHLTVFPVVAYVTSALTVTYNSSELAPKPPVALTLLRESDISCTVVSFTKTQKHRLLLDHQHVAVQRKLFNDASDHDHLVSSVEQLQLIGYVPSNVWAKAQELCPNLIVPEALGNFSPVIHADQRTFEATPPVKNFDLELHPLVLSGPSENRVDLTFFSDGCM
jgi:hypothetical protein